MSPAFSASSLPSQDNSSSEFLPLSSCGLYCSCQEHPCFRFSSWSSVWSCVSLSPSFIPRLPLHLLRLKRLCLCPHLCSFFLILLSIPSLPSSGHELDSSHTLFLLPLESLIVRLPSSRGDRLCLGFIPPKKRVSPGRLSSHSTSGACLVEETSSVTCFSVAGENIPLSPHSVVDTLLRCSVTFTISVYCPVYNLVLCRLPFLWFTSFPSVSCFQLTLTLSFLKIS